MTYTNFIISILNIDFFSFIKIPKDSSTRHYQKRKSDNMATSDTKIFKV